MLQIGVKENLVWFILLLRRCVPPQLSYSNDGRVYTAGIRSPDCLSPPQIFFPAAGSHNNCITIIN